AGFAMLVGALVIGGLGSGVQHPIGAHLVSQAFSGARPRPAPAPYNFSGGLGQIAVPAGTAWLFSLVRRGARAPGVGRARLAAAVAILAMRGLPTREHATEPGAEMPTASTASGGRGFPLLLSIAMIDSATRMGFLTFLPFLLQMKGADLPMIGIALTL